MSITLEYNLNACLFLWTNLILDVSGHNISLVTIREYNQCHMPYFGASLRLRKTYFYIACMRWPAIMSSLTLSSLTEKLRRSYFSILLNLSHNLTIKQQGELRFYWTGLITEADSGALGNFRSLENVAKISWEDVSFLKEGLIAVRREDLCKTLTLFEIKRDLIILLDLYARKKCGDDCGHAFHSVGKVADILVMLTTHDDAGIAVESLIKSTKNLGKVLIAFKEVVERELMDPWSRLTLLTVIAGEIIAVALAKNNNRLKATEALAKTLLQQSRRTFLADD